eukprot:1151168-Pelagomonas_calceolata.AAC.2
MHAGVGGRGGAHTTSQHFLETHCDLPQKPLSAPSFPPQTSFHQANAIHTLRYGLLQDEVRPNSMADLAMFEHLLEISLCSFFGAENTPSCRMKSGPTAWMTLPIRDTDTRNRPSKPRRPASETEHKESRQGTQPSECKNWGKNFRQMPPALLAMGYSH